jgi:hypothetical protein
MNSLQIKTGQVNLKVLDDEGNERGIFSFNPEDLNTAKRILGLQAEVETKQKEFEQRAEGCSTAQERSIILCEIVEYFEGVIDECFGAGTSKLLFGEAKTLSMFECFFDGITPYYAKASEKRKAKYKK